MKLETPKNVNYAATVVELKDFVDLPNCDNVKHALIFGNSVVVSKACQAGEKGLYFPVECQLSPEFMGANNLFRHAEWGNVDPLKSGFFEQHGRVKAVKFRGNKSEGFFINLSCLDYISKSAYTYVEVGDTVDKFGTHEICSKYIVGKSGNGTGLPNTKAAELKDSFVDGQFKFHFDTDNLRKNIHKIQPIDVISISDKWHGTSAIYGKLLVNHQFGFFSKLLKKAGIRLEESTYKFAYSSRKVVKCVGEKFGDDVWGVVAKEIEDKIPASYTVYGEIVGYKPDGSAIQAASGGRAYHYGCAEREHKFVVYRVKTTNIEGKTLELTWPQMKQFCNKYGLQMVHELFYGPVTDILSFEPYAKEIENPKLALSTWQSDLLMEIEKLYMKDDMCVFNNNEVPAEGVVVRIDRLDECDSFKLKSFLFLMDETKKNDAGVIDMETQEAEQL